MTRGPAKDRCRYCGDRIRFGYFADGRRVPIDTESRAGGVLAGHRDITTGHLTVRVINAPIDAHGRLPATVHLDAGEARYMPHYATCDNAPAKRRRTRRR